MSKTCWNTRYKPQVQWYLTIMNHEVRITSIFSYLTIRYFAKRRSRFTFPSKVGLEIWSWHSVEFLLSTLPVRLNRVKFYFANLLVKLMEFWKFYVIVVYHFPCTCRGTANRDSWQLSTREILSPSAFQDFLFNATFVSWLTQPNLWSRSGWKRRRRRAKKGKWT